MTEIIEIVRNTLWQYTGTYWFFLVFLVCAGYLLSISGNNRRIRFLVHYMIVLSIIYVCPVTAKIIMEYCIGKNVYWRMFWLLPMGLVFSLSMTFELRKIQNKVIHLCALVSLILLLIVCGDYMYSSELFFDSPNSYKLPEDVFPVCDMIEGHAQDDEIMAVFPDEFIPYIRQYTGKIHLPYGRQSLSGQIAFPSSDAEELYTIMNQQSRSEKELSELAIRNNCQYIILGKDDTRNHTMSDGIFQAIGDSGNYIIYCRE